MKVLVLRLLAVAVLLSGAVLVEREQASIERNDPLGRQLLYLPSYDVIDFMSLGNEQLAADVLYLWAIQYYSHYNASDGFLYLEVMFDLITDLDPRFLDAYRLGGILLSMASIHQPDGRDPTAVKALYHKGVAAMEDDYTLAELAAWDFYTLWDDVDTAIEFLEIARTRPGVPPRLVRVLGRWRDEALTWSYDDSIAYWHETLEEAETDIDVRYARSHLYDVVADRDRAEIEPMLATWYAIRGSCPQRWEELGAAGLITSIPLDLMDRPYGIHPNQCSLIAFKNIKD